MNERITAATFCCRRAGGEDPCLSFDIPSWFVCAGTRAQISNWRQLINGQKNIRLQTSAKRSIHHIRKNEMSSFAS